MGWLFHKKDKREKDNIAKLHERDEQKTVPNISEHKIMNQEIIQRDNNLTDERITDGTTSASEIEEDKMVQENGVNTNGGREIVSTDKGQKEIDTGALERDVARKQFGDSIEAIHNNLQEGKCQYRNQNGDRSLEDENFEELHDSGPSKENKDSIQVNCDDSKEKVEADANIDIEQNSDIQQETNESKKFLEKLEDSAVSEDNWREIDGRYVFGDEDGTYKQIPYIVKMPDKRKYHKPDLIADIAQVNDMLIMGVSLRGESHYAYETPRQDSFAIDDCWCGEKHYIFAAIADGLGSAELSDQLSDLVVNNVFAGIKGELVSKGNIYDINWDAITDFICATCIEYCKSQSDNDSSDHFYNKWGTTLELVVLDSTQKEGADNEFVQVTITGDGGAYLISEDSWYVIKPGKRRNNKFISNSVNCLPYRPESIFIKYGYIKKNEMLVLVTDGLGDGIEESSTLRKYLLSKFKEANNLSEYIKIVNTSFDQMTDDKTAILVKFLGKETSNNA